MIPRRPIQVVRPFRESGGVGITGVKAPSFVPAPAIPAMNPDPNSALGGQGAPGQPGIHTPGYTPNYDYLLENDPGLMSVRNNNKFNLAQAAAERDAMIAKVNYGFNGSRFGTLQQLQRAHQEANFLGDKANASAGMLHSGETPWLHEHTQYTEDLGNYDASRQNEEQISAALHQYLGVAQDAASSESQGISDAIAGLAANPVHQPKSGFAQYDADYSNQIGKKVYRDMGGKLWTLDDQGNTIPLGS
jgi:hypothetical protein